MRKSMIATMLAGVLTFGVLGTGCQIHNSFDSLVPEAYGAWENHYIYHGNVRSKTTGEESEYLVTEVVADGQTYKVESCVSSEILGDDIYMCVTLSDSASNGLETKYALVCYNIKEKTQETLMLDYTYQDEAGVTYTYHPYAIESLQGTARIVLYGQREGVTVDKNGQEKPDYAIAYFSFNRQTMSGYEMPYIWDGYTRAGDYCFTKTEVDVETQTSYIYYGEWGAQKPVLMATMDPPEGERMETEFVEKNGMRGFLLTTYSTKENVYGAEEDCLRKVAFYDLDTGIVTTFFEGNDFVEWVKVPDGEYFLTYTYDTVSYTRKDGLFEAAQTYTATVKKDFVLYQIVYSVDGAELKIAYDFDDDVSVNNIRGVEKGGNFYASIEWYENAGLLNKGGSKSQRSKIDLSSGKTTEVNDEEWSASSARCFGSYALDEETAFGGYAYYVEAVALTTVNNNTNYAFRLKRFNSNTKTTDVMQLWKGNGAQEGEKYSTMMWRDNGGDYTEFVVRNY